MCFYYLIDIIIWIIVDNKNREHDIRFIHSSSPSTGERERRPAPKYIEDGINLKQRLRQSH